MSIPISRLMATVAAQADYFLVSQGVTAITRRATLAQILAASADSTGVVGPVPAARTGPVSIKDLPLAATVYTNDLMFCDQGTPPITRLATVAQVLLCLGTSGANTEYTGRPIQDKLIYNLPRADSVSLDDYFVINTVYKGLPITRRAKFPGLGPVPACALFVDNFNGTGLLSAHTPDKAPVGYRWANASPTMTLTGSGTVAPTNQNASFAIGDAIADGWTPLTIPTVWEFSLTCRMPG
jgi:hypothetical protein